MAFPGDFRGKWALVTGASSGIGSALARELAGRGAKLILTARRKDRLDALAAELGAKGTETRIVAADLNNSAAPKQIYDATEGAGFAVDVLINNAGLGQYGAFYLSNPEQEVSQVRVNCEAMVRLSRLFVPRMMERRQGWVLVLASTASFQPVPYLSTYAATKAFVLSFSEALSTELQGTGVSVLALCPGPTRTEFQKVADVEHTGVPSFAYMDAPTVVRQAIESARRGKAVRINGVINTIMAQTTRFAPRALVRRISGAMFRADS